MSQSQFKVRKRFLLDSLGSKYLVHADAHKIIGRTEEASLGWFSSSDFHNNTGDPLGQLQSWRLPQKLLNTDANVKGIIASHIQKKLESGHPSV